MATQTQTQAQSIVSFEEETDNNNHNNNNHKGKKKQTKAERKADRLKHNKEWKTRTRMSWSGEDANPRHTAYYQAQLPYLSLDGDPHEWDAFQQAMARELPVTFRFGNTCTGVTKRALECRINKSFASTAGRFVEVNGRVLRDQHIIAKVGWIDTAFQIPMGSANLSKNESLRPLSEFLATEVALGNIVRQELVSMIPANLLGVSPDHSVLDMCSAPGSKTEEVLTIMKAKCAAGEQPTGFVLANDVDPKRISSIQRRYARSGSPNLAITCSRAEKLHEKLDGFKFDRIICDVPCTGDGTFRKCPHLWRLFRQRMGIEIHSLQLQIATAGVKLLKPGGRMVYSTCSLNPLENEAVVAALLRANGGALRLVNARKEGALPNLKSRPGMNSWRSDVDIFVAGDPPSERKTSISKLPPFPVTIHAPTDEEASAFHLSRCLRILPQDQDTGGFFIAVLELKASKGSKEMASTRMTAEFVSSEQALATMKRLGYNPKLSLVDQEESAHTSKLAASTASASETKREKSCSSAAVSSVEPTLALDVAQYDSIPSYPGLRGIFCDGDQTIMMKRILVNNSKSKEVSKVSNDRNEKKAAKERSGIFAQSSAGWTMKPAVPTKKELPTESAERNDAFDVAILTKRLYALMQSSKLAEVVVQAGALLGQYSPTEALWIPDSDNIRSLHPHLADAVLTPVAASDFFAITGAGAGSSAAHDISVNVDIVIELETGESNWKCGSSSQAMELSEQFIPSVLSKLHEAMTTKGQTKCYILFEISKSDAGADADVGSSVDIEEGASLTGQKRRLSKAERKLVKKTKVTGSVGKVQSTVAVSSSALPSGSKPVATTTSDGDYKGLIVVCECWLASIDGQCDEEGDRDDVGVDCLMLRRLTKPDTCHSMAQMLKSTQ